MRTKMAPGLVPIVVIAAVVASSCQDGRSTPATPTGPSPDATASRIDGSAAASAHQDAEPAPPVLLAPDGVAPSDVSFPPRNEPLLFRTALEAKYRDGLRRSATSTFVDAEGTVVWTQEYLRYRVNLCSHADAVFRVFRQIDGFGIQPTCGNATTAAFPPRNESLDFMVQLEAKYRDGLRRASGNTFVDVEGNIVWTQEYLRYRVSNCGHVDAQQRVFDQIDGRGVLPDCAPAPPPPGPTPGSNGFLQFTTRSNACSCWIGTITLQVDSTTLGTMTCTQSRTFTVGTGTRTARACTSGGCASRTVTIQANVTTGVDLSCSTSSAPSGLLTEARQ